MAIDTPAKARVLIVDDQQDICKILKTQLEHDGFEAFIAHDGAEGFKKLLNYKPHCILLDIRFKEGQDGLSLLRQIRSYRDENWDHEKRIRKTPVIVISGIGGSMKPLFQLEGISDYIEKPFDTTELKTRILKAVSG